MKIAVASGKGGTGKTSVAASLALVADGAVMLLDCDVEAPNSHLLLPLKCLEQTEVRVPQPEIREDVCGGCGQCVRFCASHALVQFERVPMLLPELCHSCGGCARVCPKKAIREVPRRVGIVETLSLNAHPDVTVVQGRLDVGIAMVSPVIRAVKLHMHSPSAAGQNVLIDAPPGTACAAATTLDGADIVLLVAEESRFGQHDLSLVVELVRAMHLPFAVLINRAAKGRSKVRAWCRRQDIPVVAEIQESRQIAQGYAHGQAMVDVMPALAPMFRDVWQQLLHLAQAEMA